jgi:hypothetical protein
MRTTCKESERQRERERERDVVLMWLLLDDRSQYIGANGICCGIASESQLVHRVPFVIGHVHLVYCIIPRRYQ